MPNTETIEVVRKVARERLYPSWTNPNRLVLQARRRLFEHWLQEVPGSSLKVLDVGGRIQPYRVLLDGRCARYVGVDLRQTPLVDVIGNVLQLPFADGQFDLAFCTQVMEYIANPRAVVTEIHRCLKPAGFLLLSVPAVFPRDSEVEYWRFLPCAVRDLLADFSKVEVAPEGNSLVGLFRTLNVCAVGFAKPAVLGKLLSFTLVPLLNVVGAGVEKLGLTADDRFSANFSAFAQK
jgi:SAM-dependent methyltransferase